MKFFALAAVAAAYTLPAPHASEQQIVGGGDALLDAPGVTNLTVYQRIATGADTTAFAALVDQFPDLVAQLNSTLANYTAFVPLDTAFATLPAGLLNSTAANRSIATYHIADEYAPFSRMFRFYTLPSLLAEPGLGDAPQRLRVRFEKHLGLSINFDAHVVTKDVSATNGVVHTVDSVLVPPTPVADALARVPADFSTYLLALNRTGLAADLDDAALVGATVFAPSNVAFAKLGAKINAFLFGTPAGLKYLAALLQYSVAPDAAVYSDSYYGPADFAVDAMDTTAEEVDGGLVVRRHYNLPTLLDGPPLSVNVTNYPGYSIILVNTATSVVVSDILAQNGVVQEVSSVVFPPLPMPNGTSHGYPWWNSRPVKTVADVVARLGPYVDDAGEDYFEL